MQSIRKKNGLLRKAQVIENTYEVLFYIGEGAFGEVYRVNHRYLGVQVLKLFKQEFADSANIDEIAREAKILAQITHPNVVRVFEANDFHLDGIRRHFITMGFVSGESLTQLLTRKIYLEPLEAVLLMIDAMRGLCAAHESPSPIIHRDINTDNILISYDFDKPKALISDFGLAQPIDMGGHLPGAAGRYPYMAPECFWGSYILPSDVFSAGVVLYKMITGLHPWQYKFDHVGDDPEEIVTEVLRARKSDCRPPSFHNEACDKRLDEIVLRAISKDLEERYPNARRFLDALDQWIVAANADNTDFANIGREKLNSLAMPKKVNLRGTGKGFDRIAGMADLKNILYQDIIRPLSEPELYEEYGVTPPNGMLLYGPPGCGKTFIAQRLAEEIAYNYIEIKPSDLASTYIHGSQEKIGKLFKDAAAKSPTLIFIDEVDAILPNREGSLNQHYAAEVNEFLAQMTECSKKSIFVVAATNRPERIDPAMLRTGRMDKVVYIGPPDNAARIEMLRLCFSARPIEDRFDFESIAQATNQYVSSDIQFLVNEASRAALQDKAKITTQHVLNAIHKYPPSISQGQIRAYEKYRDSRTFSN